MKLHQLRYAVEIAKHGHNISKAANVLCTSQSGISKQIRMLEDELGITLFVRKGRNLIGLTPAGKEVVKHASMALEKVNDIKQVADQYNSRQGQGTLTIATTHTQARYVLPFVVERFVKAFHSINLNLQQGTPVDVAGLVAGGEADLAIATEALEGREELLTLPCYQWARSIIVPENHPLSRLKKLNLEDIIDFPLITYALGFTGRHQVDEAFAAKSLKPNIVLTAVDADVIKTYVRLGIGIGIIANMAFNERLDNGLLALDASHLFGISTTLIGIKRDKYIRSYIYNFIEMFAPHLTEEVVKEAEECRSVKERKQLFSTFSIPLL